MTPKQRRWLFAGIKLAIVALLVWGLRRTLAQAFGDLRAHPLHPQFGLLVASAALYLLALLPPALFWHRLMWDMGQRVGLFAAIRAYYIGHLGKYVPGKALVVVLRAGLVRGPGVSGAVAAVSVFVETLTMMASGSFLAAALIALRTERNWLYVGVAALFMLISGLPTLPPVFKRIIRLTRLARASPHAAEQLERIRYRTLLFGWLATGVGWFVMGLSLTAVLHSFGPSAVDWIEGLPTTTMVVCVSVVLGFMSFLPGGIGVRELVLLDLMKSFCSTEVAVAAAIVLRLVWLAAELVAAGVFYSIHITRAKPQAIDRPTGPTPSNSPGP